jgi:hypothetical protein
MLEHVHKHIISELQQSAKTDIIFILSSIALNLITLAINAGSVEKSRTDDTILAVMVIVVALNEIKIVRRHSNILVFLMYISFHSFH